MRNLLKYAPFRFGVPMGFCAVGLTAMLLPGASAAVLCTGWIVALLPLLLIYKARPWSGIAGGWVVLTASVALWVGICVNCHYFIGIHPDADVSRPVLMNFDAWSAWNNALVDIGRDDAMFCDWPALGYGHFVGLIVALTGPDISIPIMFNAFCALATIVLAGSMGAECVDGSRADKQRMAWVTMLFTSAMAYFMVSGTILIKDCPVALAIALSAWAGLQARKGRLLWPAIALVPALIMVLYMRPNFVLVLSAIVALTGFAASKRGRGATLALVLPLVIIFFIVQYHEHAEYIGKYARMVGAFDHQEEGELVRNADYSQISRYFLMPFWLRILLLPVVAGIQFLIPLPFNFDKYTVFGPCMMLAHFGFCRYALGGLVMYFECRQFSRRVPGRLKMLTLSGILIYLAIAYCYAGIISRYGIPLIALFTPAAAYCWLNYRHERAFRIWAMVFIAALAIALTLAYYFTK
ncbi:MAG: hypothetical protein K2M12_07720 [Muribaculaceae bacterium]|nr:hypothetical protein [Muribaculaceae bacterium]